MESERLIKLTNDEIFRIKSCLLARKKFLETLRQDENTKIDFVNEMAKEHNEEIDKEHEEIDGIYSKIDILSSNKVCEDLEKLSKADLILKIKELENKNYEIKEEIEDLKYDLELYKNSESASTLAVADYFSNYENIQKRYDANNVSYQMENIEDVSKVFGLRVNNIQGFSSLSEDDKEIFTNGIVRFLNTYGLGNRVPYLPVKVWKEGNEFRFLTLEGGERQQFMNSKGDVY